VRRRLEVEVWLRECKMDMLKAEEAHECNADRHCLPSHARTFMGGHTLRSCLRTRLTARRIGTRQACAASGCQSLLQMKGL
jgi:hypothetical protein